MHLLSLERAGTLEARVHERRVESAARGRLETLDVAEDVDRLWWHVWRHGGWHAPSHPNP
jgi:hypothetical protein